MTTKQNPVELPEIVDTFDKTEEELGIKNRFVFLSHEADEPERGELHLMQSFAHFGIDGSVDIISSDITYHSDVVGSPYSKEAEHEYQHVNLGHDEMTKLAKTWLEWSEEAPELTKEK